jgi:predicted GNAT superfamily acetyltransferase
MHVGGIALGASTSDGTLAGFVFGLTGLQDGEPAHWSHMLAVRRDARDLGVGRTLKEAQRAELARLGIRKMSWTFDPLVARNAHLNFNRLGARIVDYVPNMYGAAMSPLHGTLETDRLVVSCDTSRQVSGSRDSPEALCGPLARTLRDSGSDGLPPWIRIEIPTDIQLVMADSPATAAEWRTSVREQFQWAFAHAYEGRECDTRPCDISSVLRPGAESAMNTASRCARRRSSLGPTKADS